MKIKDYNEHNFGQETYWEDEIKGKKIRVTFDDIDKFLDDNNIQTKEINPNDIMHLLIDVKRDEKRVDNADLKYPVIVSKLNGEYNRIIDGQHRVVKSIKNDLDGIKVRVLDLDKAPEKFKIIFK